ncbi:3-oxo-tetronate kinase [Arthrobacter ruber]|uniref:3-oxo-tetronate kinase n=1 Tax=Arthrobacter ruber TaxID=1258893 RepID=UPI000CF4EBDB|nr:3-oxo-tetronate kinase [Arthrobacter ruber]
MIGAIADDVTGATDVAVAFRRQGLCAGIYFGVPDAGTIDSNLEAVVIALKSRTIPVESAVVQTLAAARALKAAGARQLYFKYCSTFDSTPAGNIGPVLDALVELTETDSVVTTPSSPEHGRTVYNGYLFVNGLLLAESHMRNHPLTPMKESSLVLLMDAQTPSGSTSSTIGHDVVRQGPAAIVSAIQAARTGARYLFPDAITDDDLLAIARAVIDEPLVAGAAGLAGALARAKVEQQGGLASLNEEELPAGNAVVLAGSCSRRTLEQIEHMHRDGRPAFRLDALECQDPATLAQEALIWFDALPDGDAPLIYSSLPPAELHEVQETLGVERSADILETAIAEVAQELRKRGVTRFIAAGGETSGSIVNALGVSGGIIGPEAARGVPWIHTAQGLDVLLKSGNFGEPDLLVAASSDRKGK